MSSARPGYLRFQQYLADRQRIADDDFDPQALREKLGSRPLGVGYVAATMRNKYGANLPKLLPSAIPMDHSGWANSDAFMGLGMLYEERARSHPGLERIFTDAPAGRPVYLFEQAFIASVSSWSQSFATGNPQFACLGYVIDDLAHYYMADYPNRLIRKLNSDDTITEAQRLRARTAIAYIREHQISKYNAQPLVTLPITQRPRVLVCDQTYADASTIYGHATDRVFEDMLIAAVQENPDAEILVKTHPDTVYEKRSLQARAGFYSGLRSYRNIRYIRTPMNPIALLQQVDKVYVGSSGMGMEALLLDKEVVCFGAPFYAGWGPTVDRHDVPHRHRSRDIEELFYYFYVWYSHYATPESDGPCELEHALEYITNHRRHNTERKVSRKPTNSPRVSVIVPMHNVQEYIAECIQSVLTQSLKDLELIIVDDASTDDSYEVAARSALEDPRVRLVHLSENIGQGFARNKALDTARGEYVWFLDADDTLGDITVLESLVAMADADRADMVRARKKIQDERGVEPTFTVDPAEAYFPEGKGVSNLAEAPELLHNNHFWNFLYRRAHLNSNRIRFQLTQWEERPFLLWAFLTAQRVSFSDVYGTIYRVRDGSTARRNKGHLDVLRRQRNIGFCIARLRAHGAHESDSPLRLHYRFCVTRCLAMVFSGFSRDYLLQRASLDERAEFYDAAAKIFSDSGLTARDLAAGPAQLEAGRWDSGYYHLLMEACRARDFELIDGLVRDGSVLQSHAYRLLYRHGDDSLRESLRVYLRHQMVAEPATSPLTYSRAAQRRRRLYLHIGSTKTGSTYLQHFCDENRAALINEGLWYPEFGITWQPGRPHKTAGHAKFMPESKNETGGPLLKRLLGGLDMLPAPIEAVILSSEAFFLAQRPATLATYLSSYFDVRIIVYLRRQDDWANSQYTEFVGGGAFNRVSDTPEEWLNSSLTRRRLDYSAVLDEWAKVVGDNAITVRPYEKQQMEKGDLVTDFMAQVGIRDESSLVRPGKEHANDVSLGAGHISLLRHFNALPFASQEHYLSFIEAVTRRAQARDATGAKPELLGSELRAQLMENVELTNAEVARRYLGRSDGRLFLNEPMHEKIDRETPDLPHEEVEAIFALYEELGKPRTLTLTERTANAETRGPSAPQQNAASSVALGPSKAAPSERGAVAPEPTSPARSSAAAVADGSAAFVQRRAARRKLRKLAQDPVRFLRDSRVPALRLVGDAVAPLAPSQTWVAQSLRRLAFPATREAEEPRVRSVSARKLMKLRQSPLAFIKDSKHPALRPIALFLPDR